MIKSVIKLPLWASTAIGIVSVLVVTLLPSYLGIATIPFFSGIDFLLQLLSIFLMSCALTIDCARYFFPRNLRKNIYAAIFIFSCFIGCLIESLKFVMRKGSEIEYGGLLITAIAATTAILFICFCIIPRLRKELKKQT